MKVNDCVTSHVKHIKNPDGIIIGVLENNKYPYIVKRASDNSTYRARQEELEII